MAATQVVGAWSGALGERALPFGHRHLRSQSPGGKIHMAKRCYLIVNPVSGSTSPAKVQWVVRRLTELGFSPELLATTCAEDPARFASRICADDAEPLILAAG